MAVRARVVAISRDLLRFDRSQMQVAIAVRNAVGVVIPLIAGILSGHTLAGLTASIGALQVAMVDRPEPIRLKLGRMVLAGAISALAVFAGSATGATAWLAVTMTILWGCAGGFLMALNPDAGPFALAGMILVIVMANQPHGPGRAGQLAGLVFLGGLLQTGLALIPLSTRRFPVERAALAEILNQLAEYACTLPASTAPPPATAALEQAHRLFGSLRGSHDPLVEDLRALLGQSERVRVELIALVAAHEDVVRNRTDAAEDRLGVVLAAMADVLQAIASVVTGDRESTLLPAPFRALATAAANLETIPLPAPQRDQLIGHAERARDLLRAMARAARETRERTTAARLPREISLPWQLRLHSPLATLRANLSLHSAALRHALRLAICLGVADSLARAAALPRGYWVPMTVALVLRPDFTTTLERGLARIIGTAIGLLLATGLVHLIFAGQWEQIALIGLLFFLVRIFGPNNYAWLSIAVTGLIVVLLSFAGASPGPTMIDRGLNTLLGGALALVAFFVWPTWERRRVPGVLAALLLAYRDYFQAVMSAYLGPAKTKPVKLTTVRLAARLARSNAEVSVDRLQSEPVGSEAEVKRALAILANSHRFVNGVLALEADLRQAPPPTAIGPWLLFADGVTTTLDELARVICTGTPPAAPLPDLRAASRLLITGTSQPDVAADLAAKRDTRPAPSLIAAEIDRIVNGLTMLIAEIVPAAETVTPPAPANVPSPPARRPASAGS